jgi:pSer/pThr/pTyr-binding forkhead associated (FHA) protein
MQVRVKILHGSNAGQEVKIPTPKCLIGRGDECHLKPQSDAVSRKHCVIITTDTEVVVRDLNSRNGTFVNGERVGEESVLLSGDQLRVGPLEFEMVIEQTAARAKRPKVSDIKEAVARTAEGGTSSATSDLGEVTDWLSELDDADRERRTTDPETRQFRLDDTTDRGTVVEAKEGATTDTKALPPDEAQPKKKEKKPPPGKLPPRPGAQTKDSREAASDMLKKFFNRR